MVKHKKYFTTGDVAKYCEVDINTVKHWIRGGDLKGFQTPSGHYRITRNRFIHFIKEQGFSYDAVYFGKEIDALDVLVVDDDPGYQDLMVYMLEHLYPTIKIQTAKNGFDGYMIMHEKRPEIVLLDLKMDTIDGVEFIKVMRSNKELDKINLIVVSGHMDKETEKILRKLKVNHILEKPLTEKELDTICNPILNGKIRN